MSTKAIPNSANDSAIAVFSDVFNAFRKIFAHIRPNADPSAMVLILKACYAAKFNSLREIEEATGLHQSTVSRIVEDLIDANVLEVSDRSSSTASKSVDLSAFGLGAFKQFDQAMQSALKGYRPARGKSK